MPLKSTPVIPTVLLLLLARAALPGQDTASRLRTLEHQVQHLTGALQGLQQARQMDQTQIQELQQKLTASASEKLAQARRLEELEGKLGSRGEAQLATLLARVRESLPSLKLPKTRPALTWGGYFDLEFRDDQAGSGASSFDQQRLVLKLEADIAKRLSFTTEIEIEGGGAGAGFLTDNEIVVEFAEVRYDLWEFLNLKLGALLVPFGRFNQLHDSPLQELTDRPLVDRRIVPTTWTDVGVGIYGAVHPADWLSFDYDVALTNGLSSDLSASAGTRRARASFREDNNDNKMIVGRLGATIMIPFLDTLNLGFSVAHGKYDDENNHNLTMLGLDWTLKKGPFELLGEYARLNISRGAPQIAAGTPEGMEGWYAELRFHFFPDSWHAATPFFTDQSRFTLVARYGEVDTDEGGTAVDFATRGDQFRDDRRRFTLGFNFRPVQKTVFKVEYQWIFEPGRIPNVDNNRLVLSMATYF